jgi:hypothetical protein
MITPYELSRIQNLHDQMFYPLGYGVEIVRMYKINENYVQGEEIISGEKYFQVFPINRKH